MQYLKKQIRLILLPILHEFWKDQEWKLLADVGVAGLEKAIAKMRDSGTSYRNLHGLLSEEISERWQEIHGDKMKRIQELEQKIITLQHDDKI